MGEPKEHFDLEPVGGEADSPIGNAPASKPAPASSPAPIAKPASAPAPGPARPDEVPTLLELVEDTCPKCGTRLNHDAVFCIKCGYDMRTNEVRTPTLGVEHVVDKPAAKEPVFSEPGRGGVNLLLGIGGALTIAAMVVCGLNAPPKFMPVFANVLLCLYETVLHTGTGIVAVLVAARLADMKPGRLDLAAARIFVAFASFQLLHNITFGEYRLLVTILMYPVAFAAYWGLVMLLFRKPRMVGVTVMAAHFILWLVVSMGMGLAAYVTHVNATTVVVREPSPSPEPVPPP